MIDRRRMASPTGPSTNDPALSGPRCTRVSFIEARTAGSGLVAPSSDARPQIPHMRRSLVPAEGAFGRLRALFVGRRGLVAVEVERLAVAAAEGPRSDAPDGLGDHEHVEVHRAVGDVLEVVRELLRPAVLARQAHLREAGHAGAHHEPLPVLRYLPAQLLEERGPDRPRADDAHVALHDVPELRQLVELRAAQQAPHRRDLAFGAARQLVAEVWPEPLLGVWRERAELVHRVDH